MDRDLTMENLNKKLASLRDLSSRLMERGLSDPLEQLDALEPSLPDIEGLDIEEPPAPKKAKAPAKKKPAPKNAAPKAAAKKPASKTTAKKPAAKKSSTTKKAATSKSKSTKAKEK